MAYGNGFPQPDQVHCIHKTLLQEHRRVGRTNSVQKLCNICMIPFPSLYGSLWGNIDSQPCVAAAGCQSVNGAELTCDSLTSCCDSLIRVAEWASAQTISQSVASAMNSLGGLRQATHSASVPSLSGMGKWHWSALQGCCEGYKKKYAKSCECLKIWSKCCIWLLFSGMNKVSFLAQNLYSNRISIHEVQRKLCNMLWQTCLSKGSGPRTHRTWQHSYGQWLASVVYSTPL